MLCMPRVLNLTQAELLNFRNLCCLCNFLHPARKGIRAFLFWCASVILVLVSSFCVHASETEPVQNPKALYSELSQFNQVYAGLLLDHVEPGEKGGLQVNLVDYAKLKKDSRLAWLMERLEVFDLSGLSSNEDKVAFYLNAYNIMAMNKVVENWPLKSLRGLGSFFQPVWTHQCGTLAGKPMTLRVLEHDILRQLNEPRIHFALNCASLSCPDLRLEPYEAQKLDAQLQDQVATFFSQQGKGLRINGNKLKLTPLLEWFAEDFAEYGGAMKFVEPYLPAPPEGETWQLTGYLEYDWSVNCNLSATELMRLRRKGSAFN
jgi:Protein of unknown function, DUF547